MLLVCVCVFSVAGCEWKESEVVNSSQGFYSLKGLKPGTQYKLEIKLGNDTQWEGDADTLGPGNFIFTELTMSKSEVLHEKT